MNDMMEFVDMYLDEAEELLVSIEESTLVIEKDRQNQEALNQLFRDFHTIKGSGAMYGLTPIVNFTHHLESMLDSVRQCKLHVDKNMINIILESADYLKALMAQYRQKNEEVDETPGQQIIERINLIAAKPASVENDATLPDQEVSPLPPREDNIFHITFSSEVGMFVQGIDPAMLLDELRAMGSCNVICNYDRVPVLEKLDPINCYLSWEVDLFTKYDINTVKYVFIFVEDLCHLSIQQLDRDDLAKGFIPGGVGPTERRMAAIEQASELLREVKDHAEQSKKIRVARTTEKSDSVRVLSDKLDRLINIVGELVITQAQLNQASTGTDNNKLSATVENMERLTMELRDIVLNIRMVPIGNTFNRFHRLVRDLSSELDKEVELVVEGGETELDKTIIERLDDCLVHLLRNSLDHGIEDAQTRALVGKPAKATIKLTAQHMGDNVHITVEDDGAGIDPEVIRAAAVKKGLLDPKLAMSDNDLINLIFLPGFSTSKKVSNISGRGVGMDVIRREIDALHGSIKLASDKGLRTITTLSLPLTMAIIEGLTVVVGESRFVIPLSLIEECMDPQKAKKNNAEKDLIMLRGEMIPVVNLHEVFHFENDDNPMQEIVIVKNADERVGLLVDRVLGHQQTVIKPLGKVYKDAIGVSSATIIGDGTVALILDIPGIIKYALKDKEASK